MKTHWKHLCLSLAILTAASITHGDDPEKAKGLDPTAKKGVKKLTVTTGQIGYRSTLVFYTFAKEKAVLKVHVGNKDTSFPVTGTVYAFAKEVSEKDLAKWLNNQHSDGLYPDIPEPIATTKIPAKSCKILSHELEETVKQRFGKFDKYSVEFEWKKIPATKGVAIKDFNDTTTVYVKAK